MRELKVATFNAETADNNRALLPGDDKAASAIMDY